MKHGIKSLAIVLALTTLLAVSAAAASFTDCTNELHNLGMFQGTAGDWQSFDSDRAPTRAEAATMIVRLLGQTAAAEKTAYTAPFTDVPAWAKPYVQYLYQNELAKGKTATVFGANDLCTAQEYTALLLRTLGYADFPYENTLAFAREKGLVNHANCDEARFLRDHMAALSYTALSLPPATGEADLLTKLLAAGLDGKSGAKYTADRFACYRDYSKAAKLANQQKSDHQSVEIAIRTGRSSQDKSQPLGTLSLDLNTDFTGKTGATFSAVGKFTPEKGVLTYPAAEVAFYCDGDYFYSNLPGKKQKIALDPDALLAARRRLAPDGVVPICMTSSAGRGDAEIDSYHGSFMIPADVCRPLLEKALAGGLLPKPAVDVRWDFASVQVAVDNGKLDYRRPGFTISVPDTDETLLASIPNYDGRVEYTFSCLLKNAPGAAQVTLPADLAAYPPSPAS